MAQVTPDPTRPSTAPGRRGPRPAPRLRWDDVAVAGFGVELPEVELTTAALEDRIRPLYRRLGFKPGWVEAVTGIHARRMWRPGRTATDGAVAAARKAMSEAGVVPSEVDAVVSCAVYRGRLEPSIACEVQGELGIPQHAMNHDVGNACLGFLTGLTTVANMIALGQIETGLVVAGEDARPVTEATVARLTAPDATIHTFKHHLATLTLGSAASAVVLTRTSHAPGRPRLVGGTMLSATEHHGLCEGGTDGMVTDSVELLREGVALAGRTWDAFRDVLGWDSRGMVAAMHQVGKAHTDAVSQHLAVGDAAAPRTYPRLGNVGACGVPVAADAARARGLVRPGTRVALMGIGSGLNCAMLGMSC